MTSATASADPKLDCPSASEEAQRLRDKNHYLEARDLFQACSQPSCPSVVRKDCSKWRAELDESVPTIVLAAQSGKGEDIADVTVKLDGKVIATHLDGRPVSIDPGEHQISADAPGETSVTQKLIARVNERNRLVRIAFAPLQTTTPPPALTAEPAKPEPSPAAEPQKVPVLAWVLGGVGVVALGSFAFFGLSGKHDLSSLRTECSPFCDQGQLDDVKSKMLIADISLGVGIVALGAAVVIAVTHMGGKPVAVHTASAR